MGSEKQLRISELFPIPEIFQIEVEAIDRLGELARESGFTHLPRAQKSGGGLGGEGALQCTKNREGNRSYKLSTARKHNKLACFPSPRQGKTRLVSSSLTS